MRSASTSRPPGSRRWTGSALFRRLQQEGKIELDDRFFVSPMDFYTSQAPSYANAVSTRRLYWTMRAMGLYVTISQRQRSGIMLST